MLPNECGGIAEERYAVALNDQGRFAQTQVGDFEFRPEAGRHLWKGRMARSMPELAELVHGALKSIVNLMDPFKTIEVVAVGEGGNRKAEGGSGERENAEIILEANRQLQEVIEQVTPAQRKLRVLQPA